MSKKFYEKRQGLDNGNIRWEYIYNGNVFFLIRMYGTTNSATSHLKERKFGGEKMFDLGWAWLTEPWWLNCSFHGNFLSYHGRLRLGSIDSWLCRLVACLCDSWGPCSPKSSSTIWSSNMAEENSPIQIGRMAFLTYIIPPWYISYGIFDDFTITKTP